MFFNFKEKDITLERCKEVIVVYEPQQEMKKSEKMSLIGKLYSSHQTSFI